MSSLSLEEDVEDHGGHRMVVRCRLESWILEVTCAEMRSATSAGFLLHAYPPYSTRLTVVCIT